MSVSKIFENRFKRDYAQASQSCEIMESSLTSIHSDQERRWLNSYSDGQDQWIGLKKLEVFEKL